MPRVNLPPITRALLLVLITLSSLNAVIRTRKWQTSLDSTHSTAATTTYYLSSAKWAVPYLVCIPTHSIRFPWTVLSGALIENNVVSLAISGSVLFFGGRYLERAWGTKEFGKFVLFVSLFTIYSDTYVLWTC